MKKLQRLTATILALAVVLLTPGLDAYAAAGKTFSTEGTPSAELPALGASAITGAALPGAGQAIDAAGTGVSTDLSAAQTGAPASAVEGAESAAASASAQEAGAAGAVDAAAAEAAKASAQSGQVTEGGKVADTAKINRGFRGLFSGFRKKATDDVPSAGVSASASSERGSGLAPAPQGQDDEAAKKKSQAAYIRAVNFNQAGYEGLSASSLPIYLQQHFGSMAMMADLAIMGSLASIVGRQLAPLIVNRTKLKVAYLGLIGATAGSAFLLGGFAFLGMMTPAILYTTMTIFRGLQGAASVAERAAIPAMLGKDQNAIENLRGRKQSWSEVASDLVQNGSTALSRFWGSADRNMILAPFFYLAAMVNIWTGVKIPEESDAARIEAGKKNLPASTGGPLGAVGAVFANFANSVRRGYTVVMHDPVLRASTAITNIFILFNMLVYSMISPLFGHAASMVAGADPAIAGPVMGLMSGLFSFGGLFAGKFVNKQAADLAAKHAGDDKALAEATRQKTIKWLKIGALSLLLMGSTVLALQLPYIAPLVSTLKAVAVLEAIFANPLSLAAIIGGGAVLSMWKPMLGLGLTMGVVAIAFPVHVVVGAVAFLVFGGLQVVASLKNDSFFDAVVQEKAPNDYANAAAFNAAFSSAVGLLGLMGAKFLFYGGLPFGIPSPFPAFQGLQGIWPWVALFAGFVVPATMHWYRTAQAQDRMTSPTPKRMGRGELLLNLPFWVVGEVVGLPLRLIRLARMAASGKVTASGLAAAMKYAWKGRLHRLKGYWNILIGK